MKLENIVVSEDGNRYVASGQVENDGHTISLVASSMVISSPDIRANYVAFDQEDNIFA